MVEIICIYYIIKYFFKLAKDYSQNKIVFCGIGLLSFYFGALVLGSFIIYYVLGINSNRPIYFISSFSRIRLLTMPFGITFACLIHYLLEKQFRKESKVVKDEIEDIGKKSEENI